MCDYTAFKKWEFFKKIYSVNIYILSSTFNCWCSICFICYLYTYIVYIVLVTQNALLSTFLILLTCSKCTFTNFYYLAPTFTKFITFSLLPPSTNFYYLLTIFTNFYTTFTKFWLPSIKFYELLATHHFIVLPTADAFKSS